jgi:hypothetical protein
MLASLQARVRNFADARTALRVDAITHERWRIRVLFAIALFKLCNFFGGSWDIQWHLSIGRETLWIPPHMMVFVAFFGGALLAALAIANETWLVRAGNHVPHTLGIGPVHAAPAFITILLGYLGAMLSGGFDEAWHRAFGIDSTLWSPPHLCIMASTLLVDFSLMFGIVLSARRSGAGIDWKSPLFWGIVLPGAYTFESFNFQMSQGFIEGYRAGGVGLMGLLFPILVGAAVPFAMLISIILARRFWIVLPIFATAIVLQYIGMGIAAAGFALLKPVSVIALFIEQNRESMIAIASGFMQKVGFGGWAGYQQTWGMWLSIVPLMLVAWLDRWAWARKHPLIAAPVYSASLVLVGWVGFRQLPVLRDYPTTLFDVALGMLVSAAIGMLLAWLGLELTHRWASADSGN